MSWCGLQVNNFETGLGEECMCGSKWTNLNRSTRGVPSVHVVGTEREVSHMTYPIMHVGFDPTWEPREQNKHTDRDTTENITFPQTTYADGNKVSAECVI